MNEFRLERYFAKYEFSTKYLLSSSDCESLVMTEVVSGAGEELKRLWRGLSLGYTESQGRPLLREMIAADYENIKSEQLIVAAPEELIFIAIQALLHAGDEVIVLQPAYQSLSEVARSVGCTVVHWPLRLHENHWELDLDQLQKLITSKTRMIVVNFPHNPTGYQPEADWVDELVRIARSHRIVLFSDEMYRYLVNESSSPLPAICDLYELGISLSGLSKAYSAPGLRIGWLVSRIPGFIPSCQIWRDYTTICNSAPSEVLACMILENKRKIIFQNQRLIQANLSQAIEFFLNYPNIFQWISPKAGPITFPRWIGEASLDDFCHNLVERAGVMLVPGSQFNYPEPHFRIGLGRINFGEGLEKLGEFLRSN